MALCAGWITDPAEPSGQRRCGIRLDDALTIAGFTAHPCCNSTEVSPDWPPMTWPTRMLA